MKELTNSDKLVVNLNGGTPNKRSFGYSLNIKKAKASILKGVKRTKDIDVEIKSGCVNMRFSGGAYQETVLPLFKLWKQRVDQEIILCGAKIKVVSVEVGLESSAKHVDTKLVVMVNSNRIVIHCYNSTQNVMIQGRNRENFVSNILEPYFRQQIESSLERINKVNKEVKEILETQGNIRQNENAQQSCPHCDMRTTSTLKLRAHVKTCHTKPELKSPENRKQLKLVDGQPVTPCVDNNIEDTLPEVQDIFECNLCDFDTFTKTELEDHIQRSHVHIENTVEVVETHDSVEDLNDYDLNEKPMEEQTNQTASVNLSTCSKCDFVTNDESQFEMHYQLKHKRVHVELQPDDLNFISCKECDYKCRLNIQLKKHINS